MAAKFAMVAIVFAAKCSLGGIPKFGWCEKVLPLFLIAA
jgi:hypothetical protein